MSREYVTVRIEVRTVRKIGAGDGRTEGRHAIRVRGGGNGLRAPESLRNAPTGTARSRRGSRSATHRLAAVAEHTGSPEQLNLPLSLPSSCCYADPIELRIGI